MDTAKKKNNHLLPRMVIKRWEECDGKVYVKSQGKARKIRKLDYSKKYYYSLGKVDDELENRIANFETYVGGLLKELNSAEESIEISLNDMEILKLYVVLQSCRNDNTSSYIRKDESGLYKNNNYIFGVPLVYTQEEAVELTSFICDEFNRIKDLKDDEVQAHSKSVQVASSLTMRLHLVIAKNEQKGFLVSETTAVTECTIDGDYLFTYTPVSPKFGLILAKTKYFYTSEDIEYAKERLGMKHSYCPDPYLSDVLDDKKLISNTTVKGNRISINFIRLTNDEIYRLNSVIYQDGRKILFSCQDSLNEAMKLNFSRVIYVSQ